MNELLKKMSQLGEGKEGGEQRVSKGGRKRRKEGEVQILIREDDKGEGKICEVIEKG